MHLKIWFLTEKEPVVYSALSFTSHGLFFLEEISDLRTLFYTKHSKENIKYSKHTQKHLITLFIA